MSVAFISIAMAAFGQPAAAAETCPVDREAMMSLDFRAFDQDPDGGWRPLARRPECREVAADLIAAYRDRVEARARSLAWHEGQVRAELGQTEEAIALMDRARRPPMLWGVGQDDWNAYVDATIAFLRLDRPALLHARERLAAFPVPPNYRWLDERGVVHEGRPPGWPYNLRVVDALIRCFGRSYAEAYSAPECTGRTD